MNIGLTHRTGRRIRRPGRRLAATAAVLGMLAVPATAGAATVGGGAHGVQGHVDVLGIVPVDIGPLPAVTLPAAGGGPFNAALLSTTLLGLATVDAAKVSTQGAATPGSANSSARVANVDVAGLVRVQVAESSCAATTSSATGAANVVGLVVAGIPIATVNLGPNTTIALPVGSVVVNEQTGGATAKTVNAVHVRVSVLGLANADITLAQSRCSVG